MSENQNSPVLERVDQIRRQLDENFRDRMVMDIFSDVEEIVARTQNIGSQRKYNVDQRIDAILTSPIFGLPVMLILLMVVLWTTIVGANYPSAMLASALFWVEDQLALGMNWIGIPHFITGFLVHGVYKGLAWVVAVMLPPMAIFFPIFTMLEDFGYLPRVAFNLDWLFKKAGAHGKQALTMSMGFGCNAAGIVAARIIESPRERLVAILTNNFAQCNGLFPTLIMLATLFVAAAFPPALASFIAAGTVVGVVLIGVVFMFVTSWALSKTVLKGEASSFTLELPPYRKPNFLQIFYTSMIDRTLFVLWRAILMAAPAGGVIWLLGNVMAGGKPLASYLVTFLEPLGHLMGLDGTILLAYIIAIPANEIVVPTILMGYTHSTTMIEIESMEALKNLLVNDAGWTILTAINLMLFSLLHNPCSTTILTIWKETKSAKWTIIGALMPLVIGFIVTILVAAIFRLVT